CSRPPVPRAGPPTSWSRNTPASSSAPLRSTSAPIRAIPVGSRDGPTPNYCDPCRRPWRRHGARAGRIPGMLESTEYALARRVAVEQAHNRVPSLVAAVVRGGDIVWSGARGHVGRVGEVTGVDRPAGGGAAPGNDTQYRIGSITKSLVAALVMRLRDEGRLHLADPIGRYLSDTAFPDTTIAQLLSHTGGLTSESPGPWWERSEGGDWRALNTSLGADEVKHVPGTRFHYSNVGYGRSGHSSKNCVAPTGWRPCVPRSWPHSAWTARRVIHGETTQPATRCIHSPTYYCRNPPRTRARWLRRDNCGRR